MYALIAMKKRSIAYRNKEIKNAGLVKEIDALIRRSEGTVVIEWVKSHEKEKAFGDCPNFRHRADTNDAADMEAHKGASGECTDSAIKMDQPWALQRCEAEGDRVEVFEGIDVKGLTLKVFGEERRRRQDTFREEGRGQWNYYKLVAKQPGHADFVKMINKRWGWHYLELHHRVTVNGILTNGWLVHQDLRKGKIPEDCKPYWHGYCKACFEGKGQKLWQSKEHLFLGECMLTRKFLLDKNNQVQRSLLKLGVEDEIVEKISKDLEAWRLKVLPGEEVWEDRHANIWKGIGCMYGEREADLRKLLENNKKVFLDREVRAMAHMLSDLSIEQTMEIWRDLGAHPSWYQGVINVKNLQVGAFCPGRDTCEEEGKWSDPRRTGESWEPMSGAKRIEAVCEIASAMSECPNEEGRTCKETDEWKHWSCCGLVKTGGNKRVGGFCKWCAVEYQGKLKDHKETITHVAHLKRIPKQFTKRNRDDDTQDAKRRELLCAIQGEKQRFQEEREERSRVRNLRWEEESDKGVSIQRVRGDLKLAFGEEQFERQQQETVNMNWRRAPKRVREEAALLWDTRIEIT